MDCLQPASGLELGDSAIQIDIVDPEKNLPTDEAQASSGSPQDLQPNPDIQESSDAALNPPDSGYSHAATGAFLLASGDLLCAIVELRHALHLQPDYVKARVDLGSALFIRRYR